MDVSRDIHRGVELDGEFVDALGEVSAVNHAAPDEGSLAVGGDELQLAWRFGVDERAVEDGCPARVDGPAVGEEASCLAGGVSAGVGGVEREHDLAGVGMAAAAARPAVRSCRLLLVERVDQKADGGGWEPECVDRGSVLHGGERLSSPEVDPPCVVGSWGRVLEACVGGLCSRSGTVGAAVSHGAFVRRTLQMA